MICTCIPNKNIPKGDRMEFYVPIKGTKSYQLRELFNKKCDIHGIKDLTPPEETPKESVSTETEVQNDTGKIDHTPPSNAEDAPSP